MDYVASQIAGKEKCIKTFSGRPTPSSAGARRENRALPPTPGRHLAAASPPRPPLPSRPVVSQPPHSRPRPRPLPRGPPPAPAPAPAHSFETPRAGRACGRRVCAVPWGASARARAPRRTPGGGGGRQASRGRPVRPAARLPRLTHSHSRSRAAPHARRHREPHRHLRGAGARATGPPPPPLAPPPHPPLIVSPRSASPSEKITEPPGEGGGERESSPARSLTSRGRRRR
ncbi:proline-rich protein HaeIII subfamily 1-like [Lutra lutra]|uniref:proline-rich protein HaeIII subfamily 1-like n=1 Tax=Lutra lutra TaxID=9657 RepID=UPI001FD0FBD2|nr:proline-rich protein HaeIII subfamily 1-like [Lutra lutra]